ncbi:MAG: hypothetical protein IPN75_11720 [Dechloromonas sp.]|uniref:Uncharacterized protein n=1 Tax=Candidatus Dechloromonas phosphorivorans TaxID=2899244 RepID=A0A9D7QJ80_9RHOO|nr:hypothetical protein [Candidatus Dechloromonas phosphorivorans]
MFFGKGEFVDKKLSTILDDAVFFFEESNAIIFEASDNEKIKYEKSNRRSAFARASIINSAFLLEATANSCISSLELSKDFYTDVEKMRTLSKFEFYLKSLNVGRHIDKGSSLVQKASDLISQRNSYVHPKHFVGKWEKIDERSVKVNLGESQFLKLPKTLWKCQHSHAENSLKASIGFVSYFFRDLCGFNEHKTRQIIFDDHDPQNPQKWIRLHEEVGVDVGFLVNVQEVKENERKLAEHIAEQEANKRNA